MYKALSTPNVFKLLVRRYKSIGIVGIDKAFPPLSSSPLPSALYSGRPTASLSGAVCECGLGGPKFYKPAQCQTKKQERQHRSHKSP